MLTRALNISGGNVTIGTLTTGNAGLTYVSGGTLSVTNTLTLTSVSTLRTSVPLTPDPGVDRVRHHDHSNGCQHAGARRPDLGRRCGVEDRSRHAAPFRHQHLYRHHHRQRRHVAGQQARRVPHLRHRGKTGRQERRHDRGQRRGGERALGRHRDQRRLHQRHLRRRLELRHRHDGRRTSRTASPWARPTGCRSSAPTR